MYDLKTRRRWLSLAAGAIGFIAVSVFHPWTTIQSAAPRTVPASSAPNLAHGLPSGAQSSGSISADLIAKHIAYLASDELQGRRSGTPGAEKAAAYIAAEFMKYGLKPAASNGFLEPFSFVSKVELGQANAFSVRVGGASKTLAVKDDWMPLAFSSPASVSSDVVFIGYGISAPELKYDNYAGLNVSGKIVLIVRGGPDGDNPHGRFADYTMPGREIEFKTLKAREKGAKGVVFVSTTQNFAEDSFSKLPFDLNFLDAGIAAAGISHKSCEAIFNSAGLTLDDVIKRLNTDPAAPALSGVEFDLKTDVDKITSQSANVVGMIQGSDRALRSQYIIIGAHYDHLGLGGPESLESNPYGKIHHGADDNA
ncbi:MAG: PA domain-containing protein, partial [Blastocatellia bacterium]